jgi:hypothetical protein
LELETGDEDEVSVDSCDEPNNAGIDRVYGEKTLVGRTNWAWTLNFDTIYQQ